MIERTLAGGNDPLGVQASIPEQRRPGYADITAYCGQKVSFHPTSQLVGGTQFLHQYKALGLSPGQQKPSELSAFVREMRGTNGLVSLNHPFGTDGPAGDVTARRRSLATSPLQNGAFGVDLVEVAYTERTGMPISAYVDVWDTLSRNCLFVTGTGINDNHGGHLRRRVARHFPSVQHEYVVVERRPRVAASFASYGSGVQHRDCGEVGRHECVQLRTYRHLRRGRPGGWCLQPDLAVARAPSGTGSRRPTRRGTPTGADRAPPSVGAPVRRRAP